MNRNDEKSRDPIRELERSNLRPEMPEEHFRQVKAAAREQWLQVVGKEESEQGRSGEGVAEASPLIDDADPGAWRLRPLLAVAAALLLIFTLVMWLRNEGVVDAPTMTVAAVAATVERVEGPIQLLTSRQVPSEPAIVGRMVEDGAVVVTEENSMVALRLATGASLRLAPNSRVRVVGARQVEIESGRLYFDSARVEKEGVETEGVETDNRALLEIRAGGAVIRDVGTQLEVARDPEQVRLRVREGLGQLRVGSRQANAGAGERLTVSGRDQQQAAELLIERGEFESTIETWRWILEIAPPFSLDGATLGQYLEWIARETGWQIDTTSPGVAERLDKKTCCVETTSPPDQPDEVLSTLGLASRVEGDSLIVFVP